MNHLSFMTFENLFFNVVQIFVDMVNLWETGLQEHLNYVIEQISRRLAHVFCLYFFIPLQLSEKFTKLKNILVMSGDQMAFCHHNVEFARKSPPVQFVKERNVKREVQAISIKTRLGAGGRRRKFLKRQRMKLEFFEKQNFIGAGLGEVDPGDFLRRNFSHSFTNYESNTNIRMYFKVLLL